MQTWQTWLKRIAGAALIAGGLFYFIHRLRSLLDWPHLYPDLGQLGVGNLLFFGLTLLCLCFAWICGSYLLLNAEGKVLPLLLPAAGFLVLMFLGTLCVTRAVGEIPCTYTTSMAAYREEFSPRAFLVRSDYLCPLSPAGEVSAYAKYEKGEVQSEAVTVRCEKEDYDAELARVKTLGLTLADPDEEAPCYQLKNGDNLWQIRFDRKAKTVTYSRFFRAEDLPRFAPRPLEAE